MMMMMGCRRGRTLSSVVITLVFLFCGGAEGFAEQGKWNAVLNQTHRYFGVYKTGFKDSKVYLRIRCEDLNQMDLNVTINWVLRETPCWGTYLAVDLMTSGEKQEFWKQLYSADSSSSLSEEAGHLVFKPPEDYHHRCDNTIHLLEYSKNCTSPPVPKSSEEYQACSSSSNSDASASNVQTQRPIFTLPADGIYLFVLKIDPDVDGDFRSEVEIQIRGEHGYLSATDYPLFVFYGALCILYTIYGIGWLVLLSCQWRDLIRLQFWIGAVIACGMIEMALFYAEYFSIQVNGVSVTGAVLVAEIISCGKRTLARMLVVIVSIGFGIVRPRLGEMLNRILVIGVVYFGLASFEASLRVLQPVNGPSNKAVMAGIPLSILDAGIFYWIFQSLVATTRKLRLRRNLVKLALYRQFTNTLIFSVISSIIFMIWSIMYLKSTQCLRDWREIWIDEAYWHMLFSLILLVIMVLWRPSNNNQRFSFSPLLDADGEDEEEEDLVINSAFGNMKLRPNKSKDGGMNGKSRHHHHHHNDYGRSQSAEDELKWVEAHNIPADLAEGDLPNLDSEEELISTKFELSKMQ